MHISELFSDSDLAAAIEAGHIRVNDHPDLPYRLYNYTETAQFQKAWTPVTRACRGLIVHRETGEVLARPFPKFFNHSEDQHPAFNLDEPVTVTDKLDGSLGIVYPTPDGYAIATRGSFTSEQAIHATQILRTQYPDWTPPEGVTVLVEIIYPANRIVLDYGQLDDLILLGSVHIETGITASPMEAYWPGEKAAVFRFATFAEALAGKPRKNAEGYVVHFRTSDVRIKIKQDDYVALHKIVTGWNERTIWEMLATGKDYETLLAGVPDEFHKWAMDIAENLNNSYDGHIGMAHAIHHGILDALPEGFERRDYANAASLYPEARPALFQLLDGRDISEWAWKQIRPTFTKETINA
ncbi:RNA ligase [Arthrobacter sp. efr-133-TYG-118]|uniref:RNA ligase n=1 Tax=Arthrobacter sp. efr-133-TYG-118 TaxID=3040279 RepID=UPI00254B76DA|nr:RNA ligase [Arthrobacter sp. efr-133-TYG-118]